MTTKASSADAIDQRTDEAESAVNAYLENLVSSGQSAGAYMVRHPGRTASAFRAIARLPLLVSDVQGGSVETDAVRYAMLFRQASRSMFLGLTSVLEVPTDAAQYAEGSSKQTLRRKARQATKAGVVWRLVHDVDERRDLLQRAQAQEQTTSKAQYRVAHPDHEHLLAFPLWLAAYSAEGEPLLLSVTPVAGEWAILQYFRVLKESPESSNARYLMTQVLAEHLADRHVRYLVDQARPHWLANGLRHFQRMVGFRLVRVRVRSGSSR